MNLLNFNGISMDTFYKYATILLGISLVGSAISAKISWVALNVGAKISIVGNFCFQVLLFILFLGLYIQIKKQPKIIENPELDNFLQELKSEDKKESIPKYTAVNHSILREMKGGLKNDKKNIIKNKH